MPREIGIGCYDAYIKSTGHAPSHGAIAKALGIHSLAAHKVIVELDYKGFIDNWGAGPLRVRISPDSLLRHQADQH